VPIRLALYQPDIPQNAGTIVRMSACLALMVDFIEPAGFLLGDRQFRRAGLDYIERSRYVGSRHGRPGTRRAQAPVWCC
jgi:tRNA (cytidine/uridine-2'-O-)-methyltransferase